MPCKLNLSSTIRITNSIQNDRHFPKTDDAEIDCWRQHRPEHVFFVKYAILA